MVHSTRFPNGELRGQIGCVGTCTSLPPRSAAAACSLPAGSIPVYNDTRATGTQDWSWSNTTRVWNYTAGPPKCGTYALQISTIQGALYVFLLAGSHYLYFLTPPCQVNRISQSHHDQQRQYRKLSCTFFTRF
jgi:hypothetical protein